MHLENITVQNITMNITVPTLADTTPAMTVNGWIMFQQYLNAIIIVNRNWTEYRNGFGSFAGNYWMGNEKVHLLTQAGTTYRLRIEMLFTAYGWMSAEYDQFSLDNKTGLYTLHVTNYSNGECGDSLQYQPSSSGYQNGMAFSTYDEANDNLPGCSSQHSSGFWYNACYWALVWGDVAARVMWYTMSSPQVTQSRMTIKISD